MDRSQRPKVGRKKSFVSLTNCYGVRRSRECDRIRRAKNYIPKFKPQSKNSFRKFDFDNFNETLYSGICYSTGSMSSKCGKCGAKYYSSEVTPSTGKYTLCCLDGKVKLDPIPKPSKEIRNLIYGTDALSKLFHRFNKSLNQMYSFGSFYVKDEHKMKPGGIQTFKISGVISRRLPSSDIADGQQATFGQIYFLDQQQALDRRLNFKARDMSDKNAKSLDELILTALKRDNPFVTAFIRMKDLAERDNVDELDLVIDTHIRPVGAHSRQYNAPEVDQIFALVPKCSRSTIRYIVVEPVAGKTTVLNILNANTDPLLYPLLMPFGTPGFHLKIPHQTGNRNVSMREFYSYNSQVRDDHNEAENHGNCEHFNIVEVGGRLLQQFAVDIASRIEDQRLHYQRTNQDNIRVCEKEGLLKAFEQDYEPNQVGRKIVNYLHPSFTGGPRWYKEKCRDALGIAVQYGRPVFFITMTENSNCKEIKDELRVGQTTSDRPDLVARHFRLNQKHLDTLIREKNVLGSSVYRIATTEWQKRGNPHEHSVVCVAEVPLTPEEVDKCVYAEIPIKNKNPKLFEYVTKHHIHGPCGPDYKSPCWIDGKCSKGYPKKFLYETDLGSSSYADHRRRHPGKGGFSFIKKVFNVKLNAWVDTVIDNRWVVPYNPCLLLTFGCHVNVEICAGINAICYIYKYIFKGPDGISCRLESVDLDGGDAIIEVDEIKDYEDCRTIDPYQSYHTIFGFPLQFQSMSCTKLPVYLPGNSYFRFDANKTIGEIKDQAKKTFVTEITAWFAQCILEDKSPLSIEQLGTDPTTGESKPPISHFTYTQVFHYYTFDKKLGVLKRRKYHSTLATRMVAVPFKNREAWSLRLLLNHVTNPFNYDDIKTTFNEHGDKIVHETFQDACIARGLLDDDKELERVLTEASCLIAGNQLRQLFTTILVHCQSSKPRYLFDKFYEFLASDIVNSVQRSFRERKVSSKDPDVLQKVLIDIERYMMNVEKSIKDYNLPPILPDLNDNSIRNEHVDREIDFDRAEQLRIFNELYAKTNIEQRSFIDKCLNLVKVLYLDNIENFSENMVSYIKKCSTLIELIAFAGSGKTFCFKILASFCRSHGKIFLAMASTGIATTTAVEGATTAHYRFGIPLTCDEMSYCKINKHSKQADVIRQAVMITWDEIVMTNKNTLECVDRTLRDICDEPEKPFGGKVFIVAGDYRQLLPVIPKANRAKIVNSLIKNSVCMKTAQKVSLTHNMRIKNRSGDDAEAAAEWQKLLEEIGNGTHEKIKGSYEDLLEIPKAMLSDASNMKDFVLSCYGNMRKHTEDLGWLGKRMIITNKNDYVDKLNNIALNLMPGKEIVLSSIDTCDTDNELFGPEVLKYHNPSGIPPHFLKLKKNCIVTLMRNLDPASGLCNGTRIMITDISYRVLIGKIIGCEKFEGKIVAIPRIMTVDSNTNAVFTLHRKQFPVRLAFCMTVHKVQGQTLENVFYYLNSHPFSHGQIFVAFSRVGLLRDIKVFADYSEAKEVRGKICIRNVVWKEVLDLD